MLVSENMVNQDLAAGAGNPLSLCKKPDQRVADHVFRVEANSCALKKSTSSVFITPKCLCDPFFERFVKIRQMWVFLSGIIAAFAIKILGYHSVEGVSDNGEQGRIMSVLRDPAGCSAVSRH